MKNNRRLFALIAILVLVITSVAPASAEEFDPRTENARAFEVNSQGLVSGVELQVEKRPLTSYELVQARLIDEGEAGGNTVATFVVVDCFGTPISQSVYLAWPWPLLNGGKLLPGNQNSQHMIVNGYNPPDIGPLAMYIGDANGKINSDVVGGLGLPFRRHVSYYLAWRKRCGVNPVTPAPTSVTPTQTPISVTVTPTPVSGATPTPVVGGAVVDMRETNDLLREVLNALRALARHFGVPLN